MTSSRVKSGARGVQTDSAQPALSGTVSLASRWLPAHPGRRRLETPRLTPASRGHRCGVWPRQRQACPTACRAPAPLERVGSAREASGNLRSRGCSTPLEETVHVPPGCGVLGSLQADCSSMRPAPSERQKRQAVPEGPIWLGDGQGLSALHSPLPSLQPECRAGPHQRRRPKGISGPHHVPRITNSGFYTHPSNQLLLEA